MQERKLKGLIPTMLEPLVQKHRSRKKLSLVARMVASQWLTPVPAEALYAAFMKSVADAQAKISDFRELMTDETSTEAFARAAKSREERPDGIAPWRYDNYPEWFDADKHWTK